MKVRTINNPHCQRVKIVLNEFFAQHPLRREDFQKLDLLEKSHPGTAKTIRWVLRPHLKPDRNGNFGKHELVDTARFIVYTKLANAIENVGGTGRFQMEFVIPGNPPVPVRFERHGNLVAIANLRIMPDHELIKIDFPAFRMELPAKAKYTANLPSEVGLFVSDRNCSVLELNRLLRNMDVAEFLQQAAKYAYEAHSSESAKNPDNGGKKFELYAHSKSTIYIVRLDGPQNMHPCAFVLKRMEFPLDELAKRFTELMAATHKIVKDSVQ